MLKENSIYSRNKADTDAIVYTNAQGKIIRLTRDDFITEEEFEKWKSWSDDDFHTEEIEEHLYRNHTLRLSAFSDSFLSCTVGKERMVRKQYNPVDAQVAANFFSSLKDHFTDVQFRRLWMYYVEKKTVYEIATLEKVSHQNVSKAIHAGKRKILKALKKQGAKWQKIGEL